MNAVSINGFTETQKTCDISSFVREFLCLFKELFEQNSQEALRHFTQLTPNKVVLNVSFQYS